MRHNPQPAPDGQRIRPARPPRHRPRRPRCHAFAHAQFMNDVKACAAGALAMERLADAERTRDRAVRAAQAWRRTARGCCCRMPMRRRSPPRCSASCFRSKLTIDGARRPARVSGSFSAPRSAPRAPFSQAMRTTGIELDLGGDGGRAHAAHRATTRRRLDADAACAGARSTSSTGLPRLPPSQAEQWTPQMLSLDRLRAFSVKKGCYPGQEIVARTHFLGQAKRGLALFEAAARIAVGGEVDDGERVAGHRSSAPQRDGSHWRCCRWSAMPARSTSTALRCRTRCSTALRADPSCR